MTPCFIAPVRGHVVVVGAGFAGLSCARQLMFNGFRVTVLEARVCYEHACMRRYGVTIVMLCGLGSGWREGAHILARRAPRRPWRNGHHGIWSYVLCCVVPYSHAHLYVNSHAVMCQAGTQWGWCAGRLGRRCVTSGHSVPYTILTATRFAWIPCYV
jgi:glycine/D-amino acid oxidase-like deaminating enzyme